LVLQAAREAKAEIARRYADDFNEFVIKDDKGRKIINSQIHKEINWHIDECRRRGINCGILAPWRHGKSESVVIARTLQSLGENPNNRIFIVCNSDDNAAARVDSIARYIESDIDYHTVFPHIHPGRNTDWGRHKLIIERQTKIKDGSVEAWGITSSGTGSGCDFLIADDPVDLRNAILNPALRTQIKEAFKNVWSSRLSPKGFKIYIATVWHNDDLTNELLKNQEWCFLVIRVSEDFSCFECESPLKGKFTIPLWNEYWPKEKLVSKFREIGARAFNRGFRQKALSDDDKTFPSAFRIFRYGVNVQDIVRPEWPRVCGMDPFGKFVVIFTLALGSDARRYPVEIRRGKWNPTEAILQLIDAYMTHRHQLVVVENNAAQEAIVQWAIEKGHQIPIWPFTTGKQKADPAMGLPGMEVEFANDSWVCALGSQHQPDCSCGFCVWKRELDEHPVAECADTVMASWFAREAARALQFGAVNMQPQQETTEEIITAEDIGLERINIGDY